MDNTAGISIGIIILLGIGAIIYIIMNKKDTTKEAEHLIFLCTTGKIAELKRFVDTGVDLNVKNKHGDSVLMRACRLGDDDTVKYLVKNGADVNIQNQFGRTTLTEACYRGNISMVNFLLKNGADVNMKNNDGSEPTALEACINGNKKIMESLIEYGLDMKSSGVSVGVATAMMQGDKAMVKLLLDNGAVMPKIKY